MKKNNTELNLKHPQTIIVVHEQVYADWLQTIMFKKASPCYNGLLQFQVKTVS